MTTCILDAAFQGAIGTRQKTYVMGFLSVFACGGVIATFIFSYAGYRCITHEASRNEYEPIVDDVFRPGDIDRAFLNDEEALVNLAEEYDFTILSPEEQLAFLKGEEFTKNNPPQIERRGRSFTREGELVIKDFGINAFEFEQERDILNARYLVEDRTEINFVKNDTPYSTATSVLNYPLPIKNRAHDTIYFEVKIFEFHKASSNSHFGIGLVTKPYPSDFRLPGYNTFSIAYESTGNLKINKPLPTPLQQHQGENSLFNAQVLPPLQQADIVGFGYVISTGTLFITRNGKKIMDIMKGCFIDLYPAVGCFSTNGKFQVNFGQMGFVWIEANVRRYGFYSTSDRKIEGDRGLASLPQYGNPGLILDTLLDKGDEIPPQYPEDELDFFGEPKVGSSAMLLSSKSNEDFSKVEKD